MYKYAFGTKTIARLKVRKIRERVLYLPKSRKNWYIIPKYYSYISMYD